MISETLSRDALNRALLARQMLLAREAVSVREAVERLAGLQAQQPRPPFVGLWTRVAGFRRADLADALRSREIVRATLMRGTLHHMSARDYLAFRGPVQPALTAGMRSVLRDRAKVLDIPGLVASARPLFVERPRRFAELREALGAAFPGLDERAVGFAVRTHLPLVAVPDGSEWAFPADPTFADAETWLGLPPGADERPDALVLRYLAAFGPASAVDLQTWSGLSGIKAVLDALRPELVTFRDDRKRELFDLPGAPRPAADTPAPVRFLPGFDNLILSHADRSRVIADEYRPLVTTKNLQVHPTFLADGFVAGTWAFARLKSSATLTVKPFAALTKATRDRVASEGKELLQFLAPDTAAHAVRLETP